MLRSKGTVFFLPIIILLITFFSYRWRATDYSDPRYFDTFEDEGLYNSADYLLEPENRRPAPATRPEIISAPSVVQGFDTDLLESSSLTASPPSTYDSTFTSSTTTSSLRSQTTSAYSDPLLTHALPNISPDSAAQRIDDPLGLVPSEPATYATHPIDELIRKGKNRYRKLKKKQSNTLEEAAQAYRSRRGRHPPPGFDRWWAFAQEKGTVIVEDFFDQIYHDVEPFWAINPESLRETAKTWHKHITVRNGTASLQTETEVPGGWYYDWAHMIGHLDGYLPDVDLAFNEIDESRIFVPYETVQKHMAEASQHRNLITPLNSSSLVSEYQSLEPLSTDAFPEESKAKWMDWHNGTSMWDFARMTCPPDSDARNSVQDSNFTAPYFSIPPLAHPPNSYHGYVSNWTLAHSACANPSLRNIHGNFVNPRFVSVNTTLFPLFSGSKIQGMNNEMVIPAAKYWGADVLYSSDSNVTLDWKSRHNSAIWRGGGTGGSHNETNWRRFQRHRFLSMMNGTQIEMTDSKLANLTTTQRENTTLDIDSTSPFLPHNFPLPKPTLYPLGALKTESSTLAPWMSSLNNGAFTHFMCNPAHITAFSDGRTCTYLEDYYTIGEELTFAEQFSHKYLPDIDGNSYSGRWRAFLRSGSVPIKATIYTEWHDARLIPWVHFVPMDNSFADYFGILEYFAGFDPHDFGTTGTLVPGHDDAAREIAEEGSEWSGKVLRHEDMLVYTHRLILEYARVTNDERDRMGWADDLLGTASATSSSNSAKATKLPSDGYGAMPDREGYEAPKLPEGWGKGGATDDAERWN